MDENYLRMRILWHLGGCGEFDSEAVYFYRGMETRIGATRRELKKEMDKLRAEGLVIHVRGLISEDGGGYYGSGHMLTAQGQTLVARNKEQIE